MGAIFNPPSAPAMPPIPAAPPPLPTIQNAQDDIRRNEALRRKSKGKASTLLTGASGDTSAPQTGTKKLLGE